jgi:8-oxo-dGTP pyrophosphatase MutT (NUDIX family)
MPELTDFDHERFGKIKVVTDTNGSSSAPIISAGAVVLGTQQCAGKIALIRRHRYGSDVSLPKGKLQPDETIEACAIREVEEETGRRLEIRSFAGLTHYLAAGVPKVVFYFIMQADQCDCAPADRGEVAEIIWKSPDRAIDMLSYPGDRQLIRELGKLGLIRP